MKQLTGSLAIVALTASLIACNDGTTNSTNIADSSGRGSDTNTTTMSQGAPSTPASTPMGSPLSMKDSTFVMKAAAGGMTEIESSNVALQNATNDRVKAYANMMITDHTKAGDELKSFASNRGMMLPTTLPSDKQMHVDGMKKMQGKNFDKHYVDMMMNDHKTTIADFEKAASGSDDAELKAWAEKTLPTLKMHRDSVMALSKMKM